MPDKQSFLLGSYYSPFKFWTGLAMMSEVGVFRQGQYRTGVFGVGWTFSGASDLTRGLFDFDMAVAIDSDNVLWTQWTRLDVTEYSSIWATEGVTRNLFDLLITSSGVTVSRKIEGGASLEFSCSHGHLFDPNNLMSAWNFVLEKGRKVTLRFGERIDGLDYWVDQGTFIVDTIRLTYKRGDYPDISVSCTDLFALWEKVHIVASQYYSENAPSDLVEELLTIHGGLVIEQISLPTIATAHDLSCQFVDTDLSEALKELADHFEYFQRFTVDGLYTWKRVRAVSGTVDHVYSNPNLIDFTPDDSYSAFTNRVIVKGEQLDMTEVLHAEELVGQITGTIGWWEDNVVKRLRYSPDGEKTFRDPRMEIITSIREFQLFVMKNSDADEYISDEDPNGKWVEITIESTDYTWLVISQILAVIALGIWAIYCDGWVRGYCGAVILSLTIVLSTLFYTLGSMGNYSYNIYAKALGSERIQVQCVADDIDFQQKLGGIVVTESLDDPYCYTVAECCRVANYELDVSKAQRRRLTFSKIAHLQDEEGDIIQFGHPYTGQAIQMFVTELVRKYVKPDAESGSGGITDQITGWRHVTG
jgi:hypothetical protein